MRPEDRDLASLWDMTVSMRLIRAYVAGRTWDEFQNDVGFQDKVVWRLVLVGEAARRLSSEVRKPYPALPWSAIIGMRNIVVHQYDRIDFAQVWRAATEDVPRVLPKIEEILSATGHELPPEEKV